MQSDFLIQKKEIDKIITVSSIYNRFYNIILSYLKFDYKLNYIKYFWYHLKDYARYFCKYSFEKFCI